MLSREQLVQRRTVESFELSGGGIVSIRMLGSGDVTEFLFRHKEAGEDLRKQMEAMRFLVGASLVNADGTRMYPPGHENETAELDDESFGTIRDRALKLNAISKEEGAAAGKG